LKQTLKAQEEAIREAITKDKSSSESTKERLILKRFSRSYSLLSC